MFFFTEEFLINLNDCLKRKNIVFFRTLFAFVVANGLLLVVANGHAQTMTEIPQISVPDNMSGTPVNGDNGESSALAQQGFVYLNVFINGADRKALTAFKPDGNDFIINVNGLRNAGIIAPKMIVDHDGWVHLSKLPYTSFQYDEANQNISFTVTKDDMVVPIEIAISDRSNLSRLNENRENEGKPTSDLAAVFNYNLYSNAGGEKVSDAFGFNGVSGNVESRISGKFGVFYNNQVMRYFGNDKSSVRLDSYYSYSDQDRMITYRAGDIISRNLQWSRSVRLGGVQIRRNFQLRSDLVTMPLPSISGSAAVPSTVDLYINNVKYGSRDVGAGSFKMTELPIIGGSGTARIVTRDALGRQTVVESNYYTSPDLLSKGLMDFSIDVGAPRRSFGQKSNDYQSKIYGTSSIRYGLTNQLTVEGHAEAGQDFANGGMGAVLSLGGVGVGSLAGSASTYKGQTGYQIAGGLSLQYKGFYFNAYTQRTWSDFNDIASVVDYDNNDTYDYYDDKSHGNYRNGRRYANRSGMPRETTQLSLSIPLKIDPTSLNVAFTQVKYDNKFRYDSKWKSNDSRIVSLSASRNLFKNGYGYLSAFKDLEQDRKGIYAGLTFRLGDKYSASVSSNTDNNGTSVTTELRRQMSNKIGDYGWALRDMEGEQKRRGASGEYRSRYAKFSGDIQQSSNDSYDASANIEGAIVVADKSVFFANPIYDSFAVADVGAPGVMVSSQNQPYGKTGRNGKLLVPNLVSYVPNRISVDPTNLPADVLIDSSALSVMPADQSGVVAAFGAKGADDYYMVTLLDEKGGFVPTGALAVGQASGFDGVVGYEGQLMVTKDQLKLPAKIKVMDQDIQCWANLPASMKPGLGEAGNRIVCQSH